MTNIDQMPAGREPDFMVAEKVMGCKVQGSALTGFFCGCSPETHRDKDGFLPRFSTDIAAAWKVVEKVGLFKNCWHLHEHGVGVQNGLTWSRTGWEWVVEEVYQPLDQNTILARGETAPLAICRAALSARVMEFQV